MNFLVIGQSVVDKIHDGDNMVIKPGGIFYTVISLASFLQSGDKLFLCTNIDNASYRLFAAAYDKVEKEFLQSSDKIPSVQLSIKNSGEREEQYENISGNLKINFNVLDRFDGILINMITGFDISIEQLQELRKIFKGLIYFDVHTLSRGLDNNYKRDFRQIADFYKWAECIDILQVNEHELKTLSNKKYEPDIVEELLNYSIKQVIVTKADKGSKLYFLEKGTVTSIEEIALQTETINKVGCGDVFGAVYFYNYITNNNVSYALLLANIAAGISTKYTNAEMYLNLKEDVQKQLNKN
jgi:sugar/nucleoside kinase (ribokinase family)